MASNQSGMTDAKIEIRAATASDNTVLAEFGAQTFYDTYAADTPSEELAAYIADAFDPGVQSAELADPRAVFLIAEVDGEIVGYARLREGPPPSNVAGKRPIELERIYASKAWIGQGVGSALMEACLAEAGRRGRDSIWLGVWERNTRAQAFYRKWGFNEAGTQPFQMGDELHNDVLMQRRVDMTSK